MPEQRYNEEAQKRACEDAISRRELVRGCGTAPTVGGISTYHEVIIRKVENGFIVNIGCKTFVSESWLEIFAGLEEYWNDPIAAERKYCK